MASPSDWPGELCAHGGGGAWERGCGLSDGRVLAWPRPQLAEQSLMKSAIKTSEESWIEQQMLEDKKRATDWEATNEAIEEQVARESYLQWLRDQEKQARQVGRPPNPPDPPKTRGPPPCPPHPPPPEDGGGWGRGVTHLPVSLQPRKASATCSSATAAAASGLEEWSGRSPRPRSAAPSPEHPGLHPEVPGPKPPSPGAPPAGKPPSPCAPGGYSWGMGGGQNGVLGDPNWVFWDSDWVLWGAGWGAAGH